MKDLSVSVQSARENRLAMAYQVRQSKFKTAIHASPHRLEIDNMLIEKRWSGRTIETELIRKYPKEQHPSYKAINNYRKKYLGKITEIASTARARSVESFTK